MQILKSISSVALIILVLSFSMTGTILLFQQLAIKIEIKEKLEQSNLETVTNLSQADFKWVDEGQEMLIYGRLFDVKEFTENPDGSANVKGLFDDAEDDLLALLSGCVDDTANNSTAHKVLAEFFQQVISCNHPDQISAQLFPGNNKVTHCFISAYLKRPLKEIKTPPPQA